MRTTNRRTLAGRLIGAGLCLAAGPLAAAEVPADWPLCRAPSVTPATATDAGRAGAEITIDADRAALLDGDRIELDGAVRMQRADQSLTAGHAIYDKGTGRFVADGDVAYREAAQWFSGERIELDFGDDSGRLENGHYAMPGQHLRGSTERGSWNGRGQSRMERATYTSCDPGDPAWRLEAGRIDLDREAGQGKARNVTLRVRELPLLYVPVLWFPTDDRRVSGFLAPSIAHSDSRGAELSTPYYFNLAPNRDATLTPRLSSERGLQLDLEYRYLYRPEGNPALQRGQLDIEYLPHDRVYDDSRLAVRLQHRGSPAPRWEGDIDLAWASDDDFLRDLGSDLETIGVNHLRREANLAYVADAWTLRARASNPYPLDGSRPYRTLPNLRLDVRPPAAGPLRAGLRADWTRYDRAERADGSRDVTGHRLDLAPWVAYRRESEWGYVEPRLTLRHTGYRLDDVLAGSDDAPSRTLPLLSVDAGIALDRHAGGRRVQSLEPRLFYLYAPYREQQQLIRNVDGSSVVFDAGQPGLTFDSLFRDNRFSGLDRVGDANQLGMALTSRWYDGSGERARARIGQIAYFRDREVTLPGRAVETDATSSLLADGTLRLDGGYALASRVRWNPHRRATESAGLDLRYTGPGRREAALGYRYDAAIEQLDLRAAWPLNDRWRGYARWRQELDAGEPLEALAGLTYDSCCWTVRLLMREHLADAATGSRDRGWMFQFELKGLSRFGYNLEQYVGGAL